MHMSSVTKLCMAQVYYVAVRVSGHNTEMLQFDSKENKTYYFPKDKTLSVS